MGLIIGNDLRNDAFQYDTRGVITSGYRGEDDKPKSVDYFNVSKFPEIIEFYGKQPNELFISFPSPNVEDWFTYRCVQWGSNQQTKRVCDKKTFFVRFDQFAYADTKNNQNVFYRTGENYPCQFPKCKCSVDFNFLAYILNPSSGRRINWTLIKFRSKSDMAAKKFLTEFKGRRKKDNSEQIMNLPYKLSVKFGKNGTNRYPIWSIEAMDIRKLELPQHTKLELEENTQYEVLSLNNSLLLSQPEVSLMQQRTLSKLIDEINEVKELPENLIILNTLGKKLKPTIELLPKDLQERVREVYKLKQMAIKSLITASEVFNGKEKK